VPSFLPPVSSPNGGDSVSVADFDENGRDDVAVISGEHSAMVSLSNGDGSFRLAAKLGGAKGHLSFLNALDSNGDGHRDVVGQGIGKYLGLGCYWGSCGVPTYELFINRWLAAGNGTFGPVTITSSVYFDFSYKGPPPPFNPKTASGDFNRDGFDDKAIISSKGVDVSLANGDGTYQPPHTYAAGPNPGSVAAGDFNGDGWKDLVVGNFTKKVVGLSALLNDGNGTAPGLPPPPPPSATPALTDPIPSTNAPSRRVLPAFVGLERGAEAGAFAAARHSGAPSHGPRPAGVLHHEPARAAEAPLGEWGA
jgi:hypothetical protein